MKRRNFLKMLGTAMAGVAVLPYVPNSPGVPASAGVVDLTGSASLGDLVDQINKSQGWRAYISGGLRDDPVETIDWWECPNGRVPEAIAHKGDDSPVMQIQYFGDEDVAVLDTEIVSVLNDHGELAFTSLRA